MLSPSKWGSQPDHPRSDQSTTIGRPLARAAITVVGLLIAWDVLIRAADLPPYFLPAPWQVATALVSRFDVIRPHAAVTGAEILLGLFLGSVAGIAASLLLASFATARRWLLPLVIASQAVPVFALAPLLVLWLGYGMASKIAMAVLVIFFPVAAAFFDGLRRTPPGWLELATVMNAPPAAILRQIRMPAALPALGSGMRMAAAVAPIGAVIGEWVGSSAGLGYLMLHANGRMQTDLMFAALVVLCLMALILWFTVDHLVKRLLHWSPETLHPTI